MNDLEEKKIINEEEIRAHQGAQDCFFWFGIFMLAVGIIGAIFGVPGAGPIVALLLLAVMIFLLRYRKKRGELKAYFIRRPLTRKAIDTDTDDDNNTVYVYHFYFGEKRFTVNETEYNEAIEGTEYYVMYDSYDDSIVAVYEADKYDIDPTLDIRPIPE